MPKKPPDNLPFPINYLFLKGNKHGELHELCFFTSPPLHQLTNLHKKNNFLFFETKQMKIGHCICKTVDLQEVSVHIICWLLLTAKYYSSALIRCSMIVENIAFGASKL